MKLRSTLGTALLLSSHFSYSAIPENLYKEALIVAQRKVDRQHHALETSLFGINSLDGTTPSSVLQSHFGRNYKIGDHWDVVVWQWDHSLSAIKKSLTEANNETHSVRNAGLFHYEVVNMKYGNPSIISLEISQRQLGRFPWIDSRVKKVRVTTNEQFTQSEKAHVGVDSPEFTELDSLPLTIPDLLTAELHTLSSFPDFPLSLKNTIDGYGFKLCLEKSSVYEQEDFFGRPIQVIWQKGDPWPYSIKNSNGTALLINQGNL